MKWFGKESSNVEDGGSGRGGLAIGGGLGIVIVILGLIFGQDFTGLLQDLPINTETSQHVQPANANASDIKFVKQVLGSTEVVWGDVFKEMGLSYEEPKLSYFTGSIQTACGGASSAVGPFYCPADRQIYIDLSFFQELSERFSAAGDFAQAYVIAHEVGHHIQNLLGTSVKINQARASLSERDYNKLSVKLELQADFYAGVWANRASKLKEFVLEPGDIEEALNAANAIGDDKLQQQSQDEVTPDSFTHGTSAQRMYWFKKGFETGDMNQGDTFNTSRL